MRRRKEEDLFKEFVAAVMIFIVGLGSFYLVCDTIDTIEKQRQVQVAQK